MSVMRAGNSLLRNATKKFRKGDRVVQTAECMNWLMKAKTFSKPGQRISLSYRSGVVVGFSRDHRCVRVLIDGYKCPTNWHPDFWERVVSLKSLPKSVVPPPERQLPLRQFSLHVPDTGSADPQQSETRITESAMPITEPATEFTDEFSTNASAPTNESASVDFNFGEWVCKISVEDTFPRRAFRYLRRKFAILAMKIYLRLERS